MTPEDALARLQLQLDKSIAAAERSVKLAELARNDDVGMQGLRVWEDESLSIQALSCALQWEQRMTAFDKLLGRYIDNHHANSDCEGTSTLCECKLCLDTREARSELR